MADSVYSVAQVNSYIKNMFAQDFALKSIHIRGEVSNCKYHGSGHIYFTLKDSGGSIAAVMFAGNRNGLKFQLKEGQKVIAFGSVTVYERDGKYQLYAKEMVLDGIGALYQQFEELRDRLEEMGMFAAEYKRPIPKYAGKIGIVTAPTGAAIQDIIHISARRNPYVQLYLYPAKVQGAGAAAAIVKGIKALDKLSLDCIIVGRGGGSIEDLWAFNEEEVAYAIFRCNTPIISAVGHETDVTIADYVADLRAPTPSAAAELAVFDIRELTDRLSERQYRLNRLMNQKVISYKRDCESLKLRLKLYHPSQLILSKRQYLMNAEEFLSRRMEEKIKSRRHKLMLLAARLSGKSPLNKLAGGYSYVTDERGRAVSSIRQATIGERLNVQMADGRVTTIIETIHEGKVHEPGRE